MPGPGGISAHNGPWMRGCTLAGPERGESWGTIPQHILAELCGRPPKTVSQERGRFRHTMQAHAQAKGTQHTQRACRKRRVHSILHQWISRITLEKHCWGRGQSTPCADRGEACGAEAGPTWCSHASEGPQQPPLCKPERARHVHAAAATAVTAGSRGVAEQIGAHVASTHARGGPTLWRLWKWRRNHSAHSALCTAPVLLRTIFPEATCGACLTASAQAASTAPPGATPRLCTRLLGPRGQLRVLQGRAGTSQRPAAPCVRVDLGAVAGRGHVRAAVRRAVHEADGVDVLPFGRASGPPLLGVTQPPPRTHRRRRSPHRQTFH